MMMHRVPAIPFQTLEGAIILIVIVAVYSLHFHQDLGKSKIYVEASVSGESILVNLPR